MTTVKSVTNGNYTHTLAITTTSQNIAANTSLISYTYKITRNVSAGSGAFSGTAQGFKAVIDGTTDTETHTFDFTTTATYTMVSGTKTITHNSDGSKTISASFDGSTTFATTGMPETTGSGTYTLATIPRASTPTFTVGGSSATAVDAGVTVTINTNRADASFTHTVGYTFGASSGTIATGVGASTTWTPPLSLLSEIPSATSGTVTITTDTYDASSNYVGTTSVSLTLNVPSTVIPTIAGLTATEATTSPAVASIVGGFVQSISTLALAMTGTAGAYGSTIASSSLNVDGQTLSGTSGTTAIITSSGTLVVTATVVDTRGRVGTRTINVTILPYSLPQITTMTVKRATAGGTIDPNGTYLSINLVASVQSLIVSTQKNDLLYAFKKQARGAGAAWSGITPDVSTDAHAVSVSTTILPGTYSIANSYDVRMEVTDALGSVVSVQATVSTGGVLMNLSTTYDGFGVGKYWTQGSVDAYGQMYQNNGSAVLDASLYAADADGTAGTSTTKVMTPHADAAALSAAIALIVPSGTIFPTAARSAPTGFLLCDGSAVSRTTYATLFSALVTSLGTATVTIAAPGVWTKASHGLAVGDSFYTTTTGALPTGITANTLYYVTSVPTSSTFQFSATLGGTPITTTGSQSGTHTLFLCPYGLGNGSTTFNVPNLKGRGIIGIDTGQTEFSGQGQIGGAKTSAHTHTLSDAGSADISMTTNQVAMRRITSASSTTNTNQVTVSGFTTNTGTSTTGAGLIGSTDSASPSILQPYITLNYMIKT